MKLTLLLNGLVLAILLGCASAKPIANATYIGDLDVQMWANTNCVKPGDILKLRATVTNRGSLVEKIRLDDQPVLDLRISFRTNQGYVTNRWSDGKALTPELTQVELKPGEYKSIEMNWIVDKRAVGGPAYMEAVFIASEHFVDDPIHPSILVNIGSCPGPLGP